MAIKELDVDEDVKVDHEQSPEVHPACGVAQKYNNSVCTCMHSILVR